MVKLDLSKNWTIHAAAQTDGSAAKEPALELAKYCGLLREQAGLKQGQPQVTEAASNSLSAPIILLKAAGGNPDRNGFSWQFKNERIEIFGDSVRGLWNGVFDFLAALGIKWPNPGQEGLPQAREDGASMVFPLKSDRASTPSLSSAQERKRLFIDGKTSAKERARIAKWAARNKYDALVFSLSDKVLKGGDRSAEYVKLVKHYALIVEAGGCDFSLLLPRRLFLFHRDLFRMELGRRKSSPHFCPTNPQTTSRITEQTRYLFSRVMPQMTVPRVFHLLPDEGQENTWCACPACRAFSPAEQNLIAVNSAADALAGIDPDAQLSFFDLGMELDADEPQVDEPKVNKLQVNEPQVDEPQVRGITPRKNMFRLFSPVAG